MSTPAQRACAVCSEMFDVNPRERRPRLTCSSRCYGLKRRNRTLEHPPCVVCGTDMTGRRPDAKFCSRFCSEVDKGQRMAAPLPARDCALPDCGVSFQPKHRNQRCCSEAHGKRLDKTRAKDSGRDKVAVQCATCAAPVLVWPGRTVRVRCCSDACRSAYLATLPPRKKASFYVAPAVRQSIYERDDWTCQLCFDPVEKGLEPLDNWAPSLDHIVCQSWTDEPDHSPENLRLAHRWCNSVRGDETYYTAEYLAA